MKEEEKEKAALHPILGTSAHPHYDEAKDATNWEAMWKNEDMRFDCSRTEPALVNYLESGTLDELKNKADNPLRVLIPGCGRG